MGLQPDVYEDKLEKIFGRLGAANAMRRESAIDELEGLQIVDARTTEYHRWDIDPKIHGRSDASAWIVVDRR